MTALLRRRTLVPAALVAVLGGASVASAVPPGGAVDNPKGAVVTIAPSSIAVGGKVVFTGTGFASGEQVSVKVDDGQIESTNGSPADVFLVATGNADGTLSGTVDLAKVAAKTPVAAGPHSLRFLSSDPIRSLHSDFTVVAPATPGDPAPTTPGTGGGTTAPGTPAPGTTGPVTGTTPPAGTTLIGKSTLKVTGTRSSIKVTGTKDVAYGTVRIRTKDKVKVGSSKAKQRLLFAPVKYAVATAQSLKLTLKLTADGRSIFKKKRSLKVIVEATETTGGIVTRTITVKR